MSNEGNGLKKPCRRTERLIDTRINIKCWEECCIQIWIN